MYAIIFDLSVAETEKVHPGGITAAHSEIAKILSGLGFYRRHSTLYVRETEDLTALYPAIQALKELDWFAKSVNSIRAFRIEEWSDFTTMIKRSILD